MVGSLAALRKCERPHCGVEVLCVINAPTDASPSAVQQNQVTLQQIEEWQRDHPEPDFQVHALNLPNLPSSVAGVGLARKVGMDEALRRFVDLGRLKEGIIVCFDADCLCDENYLTAIQTHFTANPRTPGCSIYFEHPLEGELEPTVYEAATAYELHLRYYIQGLRYAGLPSAFHTIGSSMAVRAHVYLEQGGMNKRKAGEDFYFLHKIIPLGHFSEVNTTRVIPSPRPSNRVPFGTGRAVGKFLAGEPMVTYPVQAFEDLRTLVRGVPVLQTEATDEKFSPALRTFLEEQQWRQAIAEIRGNSSSSAAFQKRFFRWFDGFLAMKFVHHARNQFYASTEVSKAAADLLALMEFNEIPLTARELLLAYRKLQRRLPFADPDEGAFGQSIV